MAPDALRDCFISGLKPEIRRDVIAFRPITMSDTVALAKLYEEKYPYQTKANSWFPKQYYTPYQPNTKNNNNTATLTNTTSPKPTLPPVLPTPPPNKKLLPSSIPKLNQVRKITPAEMQLRRDKGLCSIVMRDIPLIINAQIDT